MGTKERQQRERDRLREAILDGGPRAVRHRGLPQRVDAQDRRAHRVQPCGHLQLLPQQGRHLLRAGGRRLSAAGRIADRRPSRAVTDPLQRLRRGLWAFYEFSKTASRVLRADVRRSLGAEPQPGLPAVRVLSGHDASRRSRHPCVHRARAVFCRARTLRRRCTSSGWAMLGAATIGLAQRLAPGRRPGCARARPARIDLRRVHDTVRTTFVASNCAFHTIEEDLISKVAHDHA